MRDLVARESQDRSSGKHAMGTELIVGRQKAKCRETLHLLGSFASNDTYQQKDIIHLSLVFI